MALFLLTSFTMCAFAANSLLTRLAVDGGHIDPLTFALVRVLSGALILAVLVLGQGGRIPFAGQTRVIGAVSLATYMIGFSLAYVTLDAGLGALILFGVVQITMFCFAALGDKQPTWRQIAGALIAFVGLAIALWPGEAGAADPAGAAFMTIAGIGWAAYTLSGKSADNPLSATAANFCLCLPLLAVALFPWVEAATVQGYGLAVISGALTSGLGYAMWYRVLPNLQPSSSAVIQLSVPIIALMAGAVFLGEHLTPAVLIAAALVIVGIGLTVTSRSAPARHT